MVGRPRWRDAEAIAEQITESDRRALLLLARLPLLWENAIEQLYGLRGDTSVYRCLARLRAAGLIDEVRPSLRAGRNPSLHYLTDLGLATVAVDQKVEPAHLAHCGRLGGPDLRDRLLRLPHLLALYQMLAALASAQPGRIDLLAWDEPWRRSFRRPMRKAPISVELPASAALSWDDEAVECLLLPDLATYPLRVHSQTVRWLIALQDHVDTPFPALLVATTDGRRSAWSQLLHDLARSCRAAPLVACIVTWRQLGHGISAFDDLATAVRPATTVPVRRLRLRPLRPRHPSSRIPKLVGPVCQSDPGSGGGLGSLALQVSPMERCLLDVVGRHPFLSAESLATVLGWPLRRARARRARLIELGLVRLLAVSERNQTSTEDPTELTAAGLEFVAAHEGLSLARAIRFNGLAGAGPDDPMGTRGLLHRDLAHTLGADAVFVGLYRQFATTATLPGGDSLLEWRNAAACSHRRVRPDGYGMIRLGGQVYGFFLEFDRGTMSARDYGAKWACYYDYLESRAFERDYDGFPTILVVTTNTTAEERIVRAARAASVGRWAQLPVLVTHQWRIDRDPLNPAGLLGPIWRDPHATKIERRGWPVERAPTRPGRRVLNSHGNGHARRLDLPSMRDRQP